ncbi:MAG: hypothetical protein LBM76_00155 [Mycoplasmataceae bacterium]|jgi:hypothetical protein|nr:hypothetical protein [Mycoplasmataceae bacterium]
MDYINKVEMSGIITDVRKTDGGTVFAMIKQEAMFNDGTIHDRLYELLINASRKDVIEQMVSGSYVLVTGQLTIFKVKKFNTYKMIIDVQNVKTLQE